MNWKIGSSMTNTARYDSLASLYLDDREAGREDASETNPYFRPGEREGEALAAYTEGFAFGSDLMDEYLEHLDKDMTTNFKEKK